MTKEQYIKITEPLRKNGKKAKRLTQLNQILTGVVFLCYPVYLAVLFFTGNPWLFRAIIIPAVSFVLVSVFRKIINIPRPYEKFGIPPVLEKDTKGKSFPSRHVFSAFVIAMAVFYTQPVFGGVLMIIGVAMAAIRVLGGVHEPCDVVAGAVIGVLAGSVGFFF